MGVKGLWDVLSPCGRRTPIEFLEGKTLAVDASIWLIQVHTRTSPSTDQYALQFVKAMRDERGERLHNAHLIGFFRRISKLLFHHIKPGGLYDGPVRLMDLDCSICIRWSHTRIEGSY